MTAPVSYTVTGADDVARRLGKLGRDVDDLEGPFAAVASRIATEARGFAPRRTGRLAAGVVGTATRRAGGVLVAGVPYAGVINFGWQHRGIAAALFMQRAADTKGEHAADQVAAEIRRDISKDGLG